MCVCSKEERKIADMFAKGKKGIVVNNDVNNWYICICAAKKVPQMGSFTIVNFLKHSATTITIYSKSKNIFFLRYVQWTLQKTVDFLESF